MELKPDDEAGLLLGLELATTATVVAAGWLVCLFAPGSVGETDNDVLKWCLLPERTRV